METYEIHNREVLLKAMETCAGPECGAACPYKDKSRGSKSCRTVLLEDAMAALAKDKDDLDAMEAAARTFREERDGLKEYALAVEKEGQEDRKERDALFQERLALLEDRGTLGAQNEELRKELATVNNSFRMMTNEMADLKAIIRAKDEDVHHYLEDRNALARECASLTEENKTMHERCTLLQNEINSLLLKWGKQDDETDRPSASDDALKNEYKRGYLDAMEYCFRELCKRAGGGCRHE